MTISICCHQLSFSSVKNVNLAKMLHAMEDSDAYLDVFPEYAMGLPSNGLDERFVKENAEPLEGEFVSKILQKTRRKKTSVVFTVFLKENGVVYNTAILAEIGKIKAVYRKIHLFNAFGYRESRLFAPGSALAITKLKEFKVGLAICFDLRFPELFRSMAYKGVNLFIVPSAWYSGKYKLEQWRILTKARAHENTSYLIAVNQPSPPFTGHSIIASPMADAIKEIGEDPTSFSLELNLKEIEAAITAIPIISLSKPELYLHF